MHPSLSISHKHSLCLFISLSQNTLISHLHSDILVGFYLLIQNDTRLNFYLCFTLSLIILYPYFPPSRSHTRTFFSLSHTCKVSSFSFSTKCKYENAAKQKILKSFWTFQFWKIRVCNQETLVLLQMVRKCGNKNFLSAAFPFCFHWFHSWCH